jgi:tetratricopeptide (TPR) repeat protein
MEALTDLTRRPEVDARGCGVSGASAAALDAFERALAASQSWRSGVDLQLAPALREAPAFVMAHVLRAYLLLCSRDPVRVQLACPVLARAVGLSANERERMHLAAIGAVLGDDYERAKKLLGELLRLYPRDVLALQVVHMFDYVTGDVLHLRQRVATVLPAWSSGLPGYHAVLAMHAFSLEESGEYERAEQAAGAALALDSSDARAHHVMAHVFGMTERSGAGVRWMNRHTEIWGTETIVATHCWWHLGLFHLAQGRLDRALEIYDQRIRAGSTGAIADLILLASLPAQAHRLGGRHAQRDLLQLTMLRTVERLRRPARGAHLASRLGAGQETRRPVASIGARFASPGSVRPLSLFRQHGAGLTEADMP